jgi:prepilin-type N-terminal cleavage/methylation domain-containing protein
MIQWKRPVRRRLGFTLVETLVTVGLLAVLAAFVIPTVIQKGQAGDPVKVSNDLSSITTALSTFNNDTKAGYPQTLHVLTTKPDTSDLIIDGATAITSAQVGLWNGPYLAATIASSSGATLATGFAGFVRDTLQMYDASNNKGKRTGGTSTSTYSGTGTQFVAVQVTGLTKPQADIVNTIIDGSNDPDQTAGDIGSNSTGRFRFDKPDANNLVVAYYLAVPISQ